MSVPGRQALLLFGVALAARIVAALALGDRFHFADESVYLDAARALLRGEGYSAEYEGAPGQPVLLAFLSAMLPDAVVAVRVAHAAVAAAGAGLVYCLADRLSGRRTAVAAGLIYALDPLLALAGGLLYAEAFAGVLLTAAVLVALAAARRDSVGRTALAGLLLGTVALFRPVALLLAPVVAFWVASAVSAPGRRRTAHAVALALCCAAALAPWTWRNYQVHGRFVPVATIGTRLAPVAAESVERRGVTGALLERAWRDPLGFGQRVALEFGHFWELTPSRLNTDDPERREALHRRDPRLPTEPLFARSLRDLVSALSFGLELVLALAGLVLLWRARRTEAALLLGVILAFALGYAVFYGKLRYRIPVLPLVFVFSGAAAAALMDRMMAGRRHSA